MAFTESVIEQAALAWLESLGWNVMHGPNIAPDTPTAERSDYGQVELTQENADETWAKRTRGTRGARS